MSNSNKTALITGASGGIGYELAIVFAKHGYNLVVVARSELKLKQLANGLTASYPIAVEVMPMDLADPSAPEALYQAVTAKGIEVEVLVNNAGFATYGFFTELEAGRELQMLQLNVVTLTHLTKLFGRDMVKRGRGRILNVASTAAFQPGPLMAVYYASKAYVLSFSEAIANELKDSGVTVTALCPGPTESGFQERAAMEDSKLVNGQQIMDAATVAQLGFEGLMAGKTVIIPGLKNRLLALSPRFVPRDVTTRIVRNMQASVHGD
ncbi:MAG TPA: SDR family oxidoreductase [Anaerolineae bacterium]|nr:SDR family oxidoreductase [Anaerolineae bacterium]